MRNASIILSGLLAVVLTGCEGVSVEKPEEYVTEQQHKDYIRYGTIHGDPRGLVLFGDDDEPANGAGGGPGVAVNAFLWRAALETIDFMPLAQTDPFGGVIITDWYAPPETPDERFKLTVYILDRALRADGVRVSVFRQVADQASAGWSDAQVEPETARRIEDSILTRARELRVASLNTSQ